MAQLVAVCRNDNHQFRRRQLPLAIDETMTMVVEFTDQCSGCCDHPIINQSELETFMKNMRQLSDEEISSAVQISRTEVLNQLSQMVPCVGCRHSVERLFDELIESGHKALDPLVVSSTSAVTITAECQRDTKSLYSLIYMRRSCSALEVASKLKKGKRCPLHSLDLHKSKALWTWKDVWEVCTKECQDEITQIDNDGLLVTVEEYLRKHRFCTECKSKVLRAYSILVGEPDPAAPKQDRSAVAGHCRALFREVKACANKRHIHVPCDEKYLKDLIERAEPELSGNQTERHAKSMEIAQEEVLTCLGVHLHDRFFRIQQKLKVEDKSWQLLFAIGTDGLRRNLEAAFERRHGNQSIDFICRELLMGEAKIATPKRPRTKKKKPCITNGSSGNGIKSASAAEDECMRSVTPPSAVNTDSGVDKTLPDSCQCVANVGKCSSVSDANHNEVSSTCAGSSVCTPSTDHSCTSVASPPDVARCCALGCDVTPPASHSDLGYSSDGDCESCSSRGGVGNGAVTDLENGHSSGCCSPSSSSSVVATDDVSMPCQCDQLGIVCRDVCTSSHSPSIGTNVSLSGSDCCSLSRYSTAPSLEDMLMASEDDSPDFEISEEVIRQYQADEHLHAQRLELRQKLKQQFVSMQQRHVPWNDTTGLSSSSSSLHVKDASKVSVHS